MIETERLLLRLPRAEDLDVFAAAFADPDVMKFLGTGSIASREKTERAIRNWLERWSTDEIGFFSVERKDDAQVLGRAGFLQWNPETWEVGGSETELGWTLAREHWGKGYATEAAGALRDWGVGERGLTRIISLIRPDNLRSIRVAEKIGESFEREVELMGLPALLYSMQASGR